MTNRKRIGNQGEYDFAARLTEWWGGTEPFRKMPASGALRWEGILWIFGDLLPPSGVHLIIESKVRAMTHLDILNDDPNKSDLNYHWYYQLLCDIVRAKDSTGKMFCPMLGWKTAKKWYLVFDARILQKLEVFKLGKLPYIYVQIPEQYPYIIVKMKDFCRAVSSQVFRDSVLVDLSWCSY